MSSTGAGWLALVATGVAVIAFVGLHLAPTGVSPVSGAVSEYGLSSYRLGYRILTLAMAVAGAIVALGLGSVLTRAGDLGVLLWVFAGARALVSWVPMDAPGAEPTVNGRRHVLLGLVAFAAVTVAAVRLGRELAADGIWTQLQPWLAATGWLLIAGVVATLGAGAARSRGWHLVGLAERLLYVGTFVWLALVGVALVSG